MLFGRRAAEGGSESEIRRAGRTDLNRLTELWLALMADHAALDERFRVRADGGRLMRNRFQLLLNDANCRILVSRSEGDVVGFAVGHVDANVPFLPGPSIGFISDVYIAPEFRMQGRPKRLVHTLRNWFVQRDVSSIQLHAAACNPQSQEFWRRIGFRDYLIRMWLDP